MDINPEEGRVLISDRFLVVDGVQMREKIEHVRDEDGLECENIYRWIGDVRLEAHSTPPGLYLDCNLPDVETMPAASRGGHVVVHVTQGILNGVEAMTMKELVIPNNQEDVTIDDIRSFELEWAQKWNPEMATLA